MFLPKTVYTISLLSLFRNISCDNYELRDTDEGCTLATPTLQISNDGNYTIMLPNNITKQISYGEKIQVGYLKTFRVFEYIGCTYTGNISNVDKHDVHANPGQCYSLCKSQYFAVSWTSCYCFNNKIQDTCRSNRCTKSCQYLPYTLCGGYFDSNSDRKKYASVYEYESDIGDINRDYKGYIERSNYMLILDFQKHNEPKKYLCEKGSADTLLPTSIDTTADFQSVWTVGNKPRDDITTKHSLQRQSDNDCFKNNLVLIVAYITVPLCFIVSVVLLVLYIKTRQRNKQLMKSTGQAENDIITRTNTSKETGAGSNVMHNLAYDGDLVIQAQSGNASTNVSSKQNENYSDVSIDTTGADVFGMTEEDYDTTNAPIANKRINRDNDYRHIYNGLDEDEHVYNHSSHNVLKRKVVVDDGNIYSHAEKHKEENKTHNTLNKITGVAKGSHGPDNVYNFTKRKK